MIADLIYNLLKQRRLDRAYCSGERGVTLTEVVVVVLLVGIMAAIAPPLINFGNKPLTDTVNRIAGQFKLSRARAMAQTSAYRIRPIAGDRIEIEKSNSCQASTWVRDSNFTDEDLTLAPDIQIAQVTVNGTSVTPVTNWSLCYDSRGVTNTDLQVTFKNNRTDENLQIQVFAGGAVQVYENN